MLVQRYNAENKEEWDEFIRSSRNGTFLFLRDYMDYHSDRFADHSLLARDDDGRLVAVLPANVDEDVLVSHGGLTYGGFVTDSAMRTSTMLDLFAAACDHLGSKGIRQLIYKPVPHIYHRLPSEEDLYALFRNNARLYRRDISTTLELKARGPVQKRRDRARKKAESNRIYCRESKDFDLFWPILEHNLESVHGLKPVHSIEEIELLNSRFPCNIRLFLAESEGEPLAGTVVYETDVVAHAQYIAGNEYGRRLGALDAVFFYLLEEVYADKKYFDFGISTESGGSYLNAGLIDYKEGFGGRATLYDFYELDLPA